MRGAGKTALGAAIVLGGMIALIVALTARDEAGVRAGEGPGRLQPDRGAGHGASAPPPQAGALPTSGPHRAVLLGRDGGEISGDELLHLLELGNVVLVHGERGTPGALVAIRDDLAGSYDPELAAAGQSVAVARVPGNEGVAALAWRRIYETEDPSDPVLREFVETWLGRGIIG